MASLLLRTGFALLLGLAAAGVPALSAEEPLDAFMADRVVVEKSARKLKLLRGGNVIAEYDIALGLVPEGDKAMEGDFRTPEGDYLLTNRLVQSDFFMAIQVSYPDAEDVAAARRAGVDPGGQIMIHGQPGEPKRSPAYYRSFDWTDGCIAVSNAAMVDIWQRTRFNTPITIEP